MVTPLKSSFEERLNSFPIILCEEESQGRYIRAKSPLDENALVFRGLAYAVCTLDNFKKRVCYTCQYYWNPRSTSISRQKETKEISSNEDTHSNEATSETDEQHNQPKIPSTLLIHCKECSQAWFCSTKCVEMAHAETCSFASEEELEIFTSSSETTSAADSIVADTNDSYIRKEMKLVPHTENCHQLKKVLSATNKLDKHSGSLLKIVINILNKFQKNYDSHNMMSQEPVSYPPEWEPTMQDVMNLVSNRHAWSEDDVKDSKKTVQLLLNMFPFIMNIYQEDPLSSSPEEWILHFISRVECNNFGFWTPDRGVCYGRALFPLASFFNHSCEPNCTTSIEGHTISIYTTRKVEEGEELTIHYIDTNMPRSARREKLWHDYRFYCACVRCEREKTLPKGTKETKITYGKSVNNNQKNIVNKKKNKQKR